MDSDPAPGSGQASGIAAYDVQYKEDDGAWVDWQMGTTQTLATFTDSDGHTHAFHNRARGNADNEEAWPDTQTP